MTVLKINSFTGMIPRLPAERLPENAATLAENCYFGYGGELRSMKAPGAKVTTATAVRSLFTHDGINGYVWPTYTRAYLSPTIDDFWRRVYFNPESGGLRLTSTGPVGAELGMRPLNNNPGAPSWSLKVGVKPPLSIAATKSQDVNAYFWVQVLHDGVVVKDTALLTQPFTEVVEWEQYRVTVESALLTFPTVPPAEPTQPPVVESYRFWLKLVNKNDGAVRFDGAVSHLDEGAGVHLLTVPKVASGYVSTIAYVATVVNNVNEESAPTAPVLIDSRDNGMFSTTITVTISPDADQIAPQAINVYRTYGTNTTYILADQLMYVPGQNSYEFIEDSTAPITTAALADNQAEWEPPPETIKHLTYAGNGSFCGAVGKDLYFSEPYRPHAWPYRMVFPNDITGIIEIEGGVLVTTTTIPYFVYGSHPASMTQQAVAADQAGVSAKSMSRIEGSVVYASHDGLVYVSGGQASINSSRQLFSRRSWEDAGFVANLQFAALAAWDGLLFYIHDAAGQPDFIFSLEENPHASFFNPGGDLTGIGISAVTDTTYLLYADGFAKNGAGGDLALKWDSKVFDHPYDVSYAACVVDATGAFSVAFYCDGALLHTQAITSGESAFRLPAKKGKKWQIKISGAGEFRRIEIGQSFAELKNG